MKLSYPVFVLVLLLLASGCNYDYVVQLPNGFVLARTNSCEIAIFAPSHLSDSQLQRLHDNDRLIVGPKIDELGIEQSIVYGHVIASPCSSTQNICALGYFILDTAQLTFADGLSREELTKKLLEIGVADVVLRNPRYFY